MDDYRMQVGFVDHPKLFSLEQIVGPYACKYLLRLYEFCTKTKSRHKGNLDGLSNREIAAVAKYEGNADQFVAALLETRLIDNTDKGVFIHDWKENQPWVANFSKRSRDGKINATKGWEKRKQKEAKRKSKSAAKKEAKNVAPKTQKASENIERAARHASGMQPPCEPHAPSPTPPPTPSPSPNNNTDLLATTVLLTDASLSLSEFHSPPKTEPTTTAQYVTDRTDTPPSVSFVSPPQAPCAAWSESQECSGAVQGNDRESTGYIRESSPRLLGGTVNLLGVDITLKPANEHVEQVTIEHLDEVTLADLEAELSSKPQAWPVMGSHKIRSLFPIRGKDNIALLRKAISVTEEGRRSCAWRYLGGVYQNLLAEAAKGPPAPRQQPFNRQQSAANSQQSVDTGMYKAYVPPAPEGKPQSREANMASLASLMRSLGEKPSAETLAVIGA